MDHQKEINEIKSRMNALGHFTDWGAIWDFCYDAMVNRTNQSPEAFIRETGTREAFIKSREEYHGK